MAVCNFKVKTVSDRELLYWYRGNISPNLLTLNELGNGIDFCLGVDMMFPGIIGNRVLEVTEKAEYFKRLNFRRLRTALSKLNVKTDIPVDGLMKGSFKDMFTFGTWFKAFFEANCKSQPDDLHKLRAFHLSRLAKIKKQYKCRKTGSHATDANSSISGVKDTQLSSDLSNTCSEINAVSSTELSEVGSDLQTPVENSSELMSVEENKRIIWTHNVPLGKASDISTEAFTKENKSLDALKVSDLADMNISNIVKEMTEDLDANRKTDLDKAKREPSGCKDFSSANLLTDSTSGFDLRSLSYLNDPSFEKMIESAIFSEQTKIHQGNGNGYVTEDMLNEVKKELAKLKLVPASKEPTADRVCAIKNVANALERLTTISHIKSQ